MSKIDAEEGENLVIKEENLKDIYRNNTEQCVVPEAASARHFGAPPTQLQFKWNHIISFFIYIMELVHCWAEEKPNS